MESGECWSKCYHSEHCLRFGLNYGIRRAVQTEGADLGDLRLAFLLSGATHHAVELRLSVFQKPKFHGSTQELSTLDPNTVFVAVAALTCMTISLAA